MTNFYEGKNVVVLGGMGFVGKHLCRLLEAQGAVVFVIDNLSRSDMQRVDKNHPECWQLSNGGSLHTLDIRRSSATRILSNVMSHINPFAVFNLSADVASVEYNQKRNNQMFLNNAQLQCVPVMICEQLGVNHFLQVSSVCVYGTDANDPAIEDTLGGEPVAANSGYAWAKRMGERAVYWSNLKHAVIVRPSNVFGRGDWYDDHAHVIPALIRKYADGKPKMYGNGLNVREFIYVEDVAGGMLHALEFGADKEAYNLGSTSSHSIASLHQMIASHFETVMPPPEDEIFDPGDAKRVSDCSKMEQLGWTAKTPFRDGLKKTIVAYLDG